MKTIPATRRAEGLACIVSAVLVAGGCAKHYHVTDPASGRTYYTRDIDQSARAGHVEFVDASTGAKVTLQSSEVRKISAEEFNAAVKK